MMTQFLFWLMRLEMTIVVEGRGMLSLAERIELRRRLYNSDS